jgi:23S rRNA (uracil1939-C5)-methyltransferase
MKKGEILNVTIDKLAPDGSGITEAGNRKIEVKGALPGDVVEVQVAALRRRRARVRLESIITEGVCRIDAKCAHFGVCGGCRWQNVPYEVQCGLKKQILDDALGKIHGFEPDGDIEIVQSPDVYYYRNKMEFSFDRPPKDELVKLGLHEAGRYDSVFNVTGCYLQSEISNKIIDATRAFVLDHGLSAYGLKSHVGLLRYLMIRDGKNTGEVMVNLVTSGEEFGQADAYSRHLLERVPEITTIIRSINSGRGSVSTGEEHHVLHGDGVLNDTIGKYGFTISPDSFFQTNTRQAEQLYDYIAELCSLTGTENVLDLYCGTGTIGIYLAERAKHVTGVELVEDAVRDARLNADRNGIDNIAFIAGQAEKTIDETMGDFDVVICDPPRAGIHPKAMKHLVRMRIPRMIYVSCNIKAVAPDMEMLMLAGYRIKEAKAFDMSPHTPHIETVFLLEIE